MGNVFLQKTKSPTYFISLKKKQQKNILNENKNITYSIQWAAGGSKQFVMSQCPNWSAVWNLSKWSLIWKDDIVPKFQVYPPELPTVFFTEC